MPYIMPYITLHADPAYECPIVSTKGQRPKVKFPFLEKSKKRFSEFLLNFALLAV